VDLNKYLKYLQDVESIFPIDSFPTIKKKKKKRDIIRNIYPEDNMKNKK